MEELKGCKELHRFYCPIVVISSAGNFNSYMVWVNKFLPSFPYAFSKLFSLGAGFVYQ